MKRAYGFTIVELLIVIVVIAVLAAISYVGYTGMQAKARDSQRLQDINTIAQALELYYVDNGVYPNGDCTSRCPSPKKAGVSASTTSDGSWSILEEALVPKYLAALPSDPLASLDDEPALYGGYNYDYLRWMGSNCATPSSRGYIFVYNLETQGDQRTVLGQCDNPANTPHNYPLGSEYIVIK